MNHPWAICLAREDAPSLAALRLSAGVEIGEASPRLWLRGKPGDEALHRLLLALPAIARYEMMPDNRLRPVEARIPSEQLPALKWQPVAAWLQVESPVAAMPASEPPPVRLELVRSSEECEPDLLLTSLPDWNEFARHAPRVRLERLQFAADADGRVLVRGTPLPPLPGRRYVIRSGIAVPVGFHWQPAVSVDVLARRFGISGDALILWHADGSITRLHTEQFVPATRSAARATAEALAEHQ